MAAQLLNEAAVTAERAGEDRTDYEVVFGPSNVVMQSTDCAVVAEDYVTAAQVGPADATELGAAAGGPFPAPS